MNIGTCTTRDGTRRPIGSTSSTASAAAVSSISRVARLAASITPLSSSAGSLRPTVDPVSHSSLRPT